MHRLQAIYVDLSHFKWYADLYLFVRSQASDWLLVVCCRTGILWDGLGGGSAFLFRYILQRRSPSFLLFVQLLLSLFVGFRGRLGAAA
jgi:hypothetical protein